MKTGNSIDNLFREAMTGYRLEPAPGLWRRIERRFFPPSRFSPSGLITSAILIFIAGLMPWVLIPAKGGQQKEPEIQPAGASRGYLINPSGGDSYSQAGKEKTYSVQSAYFTEPASPASEAGNQGMAGLSRDPAGDASGYLLAAAGPEGYYLPSYARYDLQQTHREALWLLRMNSRTALLTDAGREGTTAPVAVNPSVLSAFTGEYESPYFRNSEMSVGLNFDPSLVFYDPNPNNKMLGGDAYFRYSVSKWHLAGGIGFSRMQDQGTYKVSYKSYDSVGYYIDVISFIPDPRNPGNVMYTTRKETIYDSVPHYSITDKTNYYSYLDFPVSVGYTFFQRGRISFAASAGVKFSVLVAKDEPTVEFNLPNGELTDIETQTPARMSTNWRFTAGIDFGYLLTGQVSFHLEPVFEQYLSPVYVKQPGIVTKKPYVTGLKAGFRYTFK